MLRYADEGHLARDWSEMTRDIKSISTAAPRAATYVNKLKVTAMRIFLLYSMPFIFFAIYRPGVLFLSTKNISRGVPLLLIII